MHSSKDLLRALEREGFSVLPNATGPLLADLFLGEVGSRSELVVRSRRGENKIDGVISLIIPNIWGMSDARVSRAPLQTHMGNIESLSNASYIDAAHSVDEFASALKSFASSLPSSVSQLTDDLRREKVGPYDALYFRGRDADFAELSEYLSL